VTPEQIQKLERLRSIIHEMKSLLVAYSGGVDSAVVVAVAQEQLGEKSLACIGISPSYPKREQRDAIAMVERLGARYRLISTHEGEDPNYAANAGNRCYFCKGELYSRLRALADTEGWNAVADGVHADDVDDHVFGIRAAHEKGVRSPLLEADITKDDVRAIAQTLDLPAWDKPAMACLSSRVPAGTPITPELLEQIERAEDVLADLGFRQFRVRHHNDVARVEIPVEEISRAVEFRESILQGIQQAGYRFVALDLGGFRSGSLSQPQSSLIPLSIHRAAT
jgi:uncharacterized protein